MFNLTLYFRETNYTNLIKVMLARTQSSSNLRDFYS